MSQGPAFTEQGMLYYGYLLGKVPAGVYADWCEENGLAQESAEVRRADLIGMIYAGTNDQSRPIRLPICNP